MIQYIKAEGSVSNKEAREILGLAESTTKRILREMVQDEMLSENGERKAKRYFIKQ
ncbi:winged helix-turn-helix transcriptional regulator [Frisingicoccus caecimuris]|uniref:winged helix-turn-helix transcriptional regulator n=1 Tax=Frisingicoccus caecimuris TaxID=1796636 RepID=UPI003A7F2279